MLVDLGTKPIHLFVVNPAWGRRARHVRLSRCRDGAREIQRRSVSVHNWNRLRSGWFVVCAGTFLQVIGVAGRTTVRGRPDRAYGNSVLPRRRLAEFLDHIPGPLDDSRERPHPRRRR
jgi:hypothetical protein